MLNRYLTQDCICCNVEALDWRDAIWKAAQPLIKSKKIKETYVERTIAKVEELGPYIVLAKGVAVAHARPKDDVEQESVSLITLKTPVEFGHKTNDPVEILFLLAATNDDGHIGAVMEVAQLLCEDGMKEKICLAGSESILYDLICGKKVNSAE